MLLVTCHMSLSSCIPQVPPPEQQDALGAETALLTSIEALKNNSFAQRSFFLRLSFHDELLLNLRNEKIMRCSRGHLQLDLQLPSLLKFQYLFHQNMCHIPGLSCVPCLMIILSTHQMGNRQHQICLMSVLWYVPI